MDFRKRVGFANQWTRHVLVLKNGYTHGYFALLIRPYARAFSSAPQLVQKDSPGRTADLHCGHVGLKL